MPYGRKKESVKQSIVEDMALGARLKEVGIPYMLFAGDKDISFRMYGDGLKGLLQGWIKNMAAGALKTPPHVLGMVFFWITSLISVPLHVISFAVSGNILWMLIYSLLYIIWVSLLRFYSKRIGKFLFWAIAFYPILMVGFLLIFAVSVFKKVFGLKVIWKGRAIAEEENPCE